MNVHEQNARRALGLLEPPELGRHEGMYFLQWATVQALLGLIEEVRALRPPPPPPEPAPPPPPVPSSIRPPAPDT